MDIGPIETAPPAEGHSCGSKVCDRARTFTFVSDRQARRQLNGCRLSSVVDIVST
jgi:hypothetical protein